jgi:hypothetical protein
VEQLPPLGNPEKVVLIMPGSVHACQQPPQPLLHASLYRHVHTDAMLDHWHTRPPPSLPSTKQSIHDGGWRALLASVLASVFAAGRRREVRGGKGDSGQTHGTWAEALTGRRGRGQKALIWAQVWS